MSSRIMKTLLLASVLLIALPVVSGASTARVAGLGIQSDFVKDYTNVYTYLSEVSCVGNVIYGELGDYYSWYTSDRAVGAILGNLFDGRYGTIGLRLREETAALGQGDASAYVGPGWAYDPNYNSAQAFDLLWGKKFGKTSLGLQFSRSYKHMVGDPFLEDYQYPISWGIPWYGGTTPYYDYSWKEVEGDNFMAGDPAYLRYNRNILGFGGGIGFEVSPEFTLEASMLYQSRTFSAVDTLYDENTFAYWVDDGLEVEPGQKWENDGSSAYLMALRGLWQAKPDLLVIPTFKYYSFDVGAKGEYIAPEGYGIHTGIGPDLQYDNYPAGSDSLYGAATITVNNEDKRTGWQLGIAGNWTLNQNDLFVLGLSFASNKQDVKYQDWVIEDVVDNETSPATYSYVYSDPFDYMVGKSTQSLMPTVFAALETHVNPWLTLRFGATQGVFYSVKYETEYFEYNFTTEDVETVPRTKNTTTYHSSPFSMMLGAGFKFGNLQLDATVNPDFVHNGPYFISGAPTGYYGSGPSAKSVAPYGGLFPKVTATYSF